MHHYRVLSELPYSNLDTATLATSSQRISQVTKESVNDDPYVSEELKDLDECAEKIQRYTAKSKASPFTGILDNWDTVRRSNYSGMYLILDGYQRITVEPQKRDAALFLLNLISDDSKLKKKDYQKTTYEYKKLIAKFDDQKAMEALATLGLTAIYEAIKEANAKFEETYEKKVSAEPAAPEISINDVKKATIDHLSSVLKYIDSKANRKSIGFVVAANKINEIISDVLKVYKADKTRSENSDKAPGIIETKSPPASPVAS